MNDYYRGFAYLTFRNDEDQGASGPWRLKPIKMTRNYPNRVDGDCVVIKVNVKVARSIFDGLHGGEIVVEDPQPAVEVSRG